MKGKQKMGSPSKIPYKKVRDWSQIDALKYYRDNYPGIYRTQLKKLDSSFVYILTRRGLLEQIPLNEWSQDPLGHYHEHHNGLTKSQLCKENRQLYHELRRKGLLDQVPGEIKSKPTKRSKFRLLESYLVSYVGMTKSQLWVADPNLFQELVNAELLHLIPSSPIQHSSLEFRLQNRDDSNPNNHPPLGTTPWMEDEMGGDDLDDAGIPLRHIVRPY